jgi:hypothetical protein
MPETALLLSITIPFKDNSAFQSDYIGTEFRFAMTNSLSKRFSLSYNIGGEFGRRARNGSGIKDRFYPDLLSLRLMPQKFSPDHRFDAGLTYLILKMFRWMWHWFWHFRKSLTFCWRCICKVT